MNRTRRTVDLCSILRASDWAREYRRATEEAHRNMTEDPDKEKRLAKSECVVCFYPFRSRIGGAAMTTAQCGICQTTVGSGSTNIDVICLKCARAHELCVHCGADIRLRTRRKFDQSAVMPPVDNRRDW